MCTFIGSYVKYIFSYRARYNVYVHVQPKHAIIIGNYVKYIVSYRARYNVYVHVQPMHAIMKGNHMMHVIKTLRKVDSSSKNIMNL
jgi:hypothetical protein